MKAKTKKASKANAKTGQTVVMDGRFVKASLKKELARYPDRLDALVLKRGVARQRFLSLCDNYYELLKLSKPT